MAYVVNRGEFQFQVRSKVQGKQVVHGTYDTKADADFAAAGINLKMSKGMQISARRGNIPFREVLEAYEADKRKLGMPDSDPIFNRISFYLRDDSPYKWLADLVLAKITVKTINAFLEQRSDIDEVETSTQNRDLSFLSAVFNFGRRQYECTDWVNPVSMAVRPQSNDKRTRVMLTEEQPAVEKAVLASGSKYLYTAYLVALDTGMRRGEVAKAVWADLDASKPDVVVMHIPKLNTKTKQHRGVPISDELWAHLQTLERSEDGLIIGATSIAIGQAWAKAMIVAKVEDLRFHDLRHTALTRMGKTGNLSSIELSKISGHATVQMLDRYVNPTIHELAEKLKGKHREHAAKEKAPE
jgi:integrase